MAMFWEIVATAFAGLGAAGVALAVRRFSRQRLPKWTVPAFAGLGMLAFQIYSEYDWFHHQRSLLPQGVQVVRSVEESVPWRPWSYVVPQTVRFMAVDVENASVNRANLDLVLADIYVFERRLPARRIRQVFHCAQRATAMFSEQLEFPSPGEPVSEHWRQLDHDDPLFAAVCHGLNRR
ncbi:hypothetical protein [Marinimicrobium sp. ABcell2]|uniref:hypothetical protein n=1 Tax=Marinimicrobium sp. ABcell2 TaxID=3069751 RepID=UPI0027B7C623|nr:hypothetical protein [Marinimicrobium sp. ABcell2]MDQ2076890.1 hypothetical protein [Marinimicrobium sp. ABcell2]